jgi:hypothetical protein
MMNDLGLKSIIRTIIHSPREPRYFFSTAEHLKVCMSNWKFGGSHLTETVKGGTDLHGRLCLYSSRFESVCRTALHIGSFFCYSSRVCLELLFQLTVAPALSPWNLGMQASIQDAHATNAAQGLCHGL